MKKDKKYIYAAKFSNGFYDDYFVGIAFVSTCKEIVEEWVEKYNRILNAYREHYCYQIDGEICLKEKFQKLLDNLDDETFNRDRWYEMSEIRKAWVDKIEIR